MTKMWLYDAIIYIYALSLLFYFSDYVRPNQSAKRMGTGLLFIVWLLQTVFFAVRIIKLSYMPVFTLFETAFFFSWLLVTIALALNWFMRIDLLMFFVNVIGFGVSVFNLFSNSDLVPTLAQWETRDELLFIHITFAIASYVAFSVSAVFSAMYLILFRSLKEKQWSMTTKRLPSLEKVEGYTFRAAVTGLPLLIVALALGIVELLLREDIYLLLDAKVFYSMLIIGAYSFYLIQRKTQEASGAKLSGWNLAAFVLVATNMLISGLSRFH
ncbi:cytochrome c biogenesis protein CcsA [Paenibacillus sp. y28]|uniref:cytochrome c biogenesis protein CcsA n=1 Tax=Paenibacillus sp. y28 TaxID=3129110 RepID=UPI003019F4E9